MTTEKQNEDSSKYSLVEIGKGYFAYVIKTDAYLYPWAPNYICQYCHDAGKGDFPLKRYNSGWKRYGYVCSNCNTVFPTTNNSGVISR